MSNVFSRARRHPFGDHGGMTYAIDLEDTPRGHVVPPLLRAFAEWLATLEHGSLGWFDALATEEIPGSWDETNASRLQRAGFAFLSLPEGSLLTLLETGVDGAPPAVVLLGSEGEARAVAGSLEEFLLLWSKGETDIDELDDETAASGRAAMKAWLEARSVKAPTAPDFDFQAWLDGAAGGVAAPEPTAQAERPVPAVFAELPPTFRKLAELHGRRADDPKVVDFVTSELGAKVPTSATDTGMAKAVKSKRGFSLWFSHDKLNDAFPLIPKTKGSFLPYLAEVALDATWREELPFGIEWRHGTAELEARLGRPIVVRLFPDDEEDTTTRSWWEREIDPGRTYLRVQLQKKGLGLTLMIRETVTLSSRHGVPALPVVGLFVGWAVSRALLDEARFAEHGALIARVRGRSEKGSALVRTAMSRGLWLDHLVADDEVRTTARRMFGGSGGLSLEQDLIDVFGERTNAHGHREPALDDDAWDAVDAAAPTLDQRFAAWVNER